MFNKINIPILSIVSFLMIQSHATTIVQWGPDSNVTGGAFGNNLSGNNSSVIDLSSPGGPTPVTNGGAYYPNNTLLRSPVFFHAGTATAGSLDTRIINNSGNSEIRLGMRDTDGTDGYAVQGTSLALWTKSGHDYDAGPDPDHGFLNGGDANPVSLDSISMTVNSNGGTPLGNTDLYWVIRLGSTFFATGGQTISAGSDLPDPGAAQWFSYDPLTDISDFTNAGSAAPLANLDNLTAVGIAFDRDYTGSGNIYFNTEIEEFIVQGTVIPEPSSLMLILSVLGGFLILRRGKQRQ